MYLTRVCSSCAPGSQLCASQWREFFGKWYEHNAGGDDEDADCDVEDADHYVEDAKCGFRRDAGSRGDHEGAEQQQRQLGQEVQAKAPPVDVPRTKLCARTPTAHRIDRIEPVRPQ